MAASLPEAAKRLGADNSRSIPSRISDLLREALEGIEEERYTDPHSSASLPWKQWAKLRAPFLLSAEPAAYHEELWEWAESLEPGVSPPTFVAAWGRGLAKSGTFQGICCRWADTLKRRFVLLINETQEQSNRSLGAIAETLEANGIQAAKNPLGAQRGWRQNMIRTEGGFNVLALGWDTAMRGVRMGELRPDVIFIEDIDGRLDTKATTEKKKVVLTQTFLPAGAPGLAVAFGQNVILPGGLMDQQVKGEADFLTNRIVSLVPAIYDLEIDFKDQPDGSVLPTIASGTSAWPQRLPVPVMEGFLQQMGVRAFLREYQHEVAEQGGGLWDGFEFRYADDLASIPGLTLLENGLPRFEQIAVAVDPSGSRRGDEAGIVAGGSFRLPGGKLAAVLLEDISAQMSPKMWAQESIALYRRLGAHKLLCERNFGGELVEDNLKGFPGAPPVTMVTVTNGKIIRAEPVFQRYESGLVWHAKRMAGVEGQMTDWSPGSKQPSPGALDAAVICLSVLFGIADYVHPQKTPNAMPYRAILSNGPIGGAKITRPTLKNKPSGLLGTR